MNIRLAVILGAAALAVAAAGVGTWWYFDDSPPGAPPEALEAEGGEPLPIPPVPPRISESPDYDKCLSMLDSDPIGASEFADVWESTGGGDEATHCHALAQIALGNAETGAELMDQLGRTGHSPPLTRASILGQAGQAWLMAGEADRAFDAETLALKLSPDDPDLLINRAVAASVLERYPDVIADLNRALALAPRRVDALVLRASAWREEAKLSQAREDIERAMTIDPDNPDALLERGILRQRGGDDSGARRDWQRAIELDPDSATADLAEQNLALLEAGPDRH